MFFEFNYLLNIIKKHNDVSVILFGNHSSSSSKKAKYSPELFSIPVFLD